MRSKPVLKFKGISDAAWKRLRKKLIKYNMRWRITWLKLVKDEVRMSGSVWYKK